MQRGVAAFPVAATSGGGGAEVRPPQGACRAFQSGVPHGRRPSDSPGPGPHRHVAQAPETSQMREQGARVTPGVHRGANGGCHYEGLRASGGAVLDEAMTGVSCGEEAHRGGRREAADTSSFPVAGGCRARGRKARGRRGSGPGQGGGQGRPWQDGPQGPQERSLTSQATASPREMAGKASCRQ